MGGTMEFYLTNAWAPRTCIRLSGLSKTELNGAAAEVSEVDLPAGRYQVQLANGKQLKVKFENVLFWEDRPWKSPESAKISEGDI